MTLNNQSYISPGFRYLLKHCLKESLKPWILIYIGIAVLFNIVITERPMLPDIFTLFNELLIGCGIYIFNFLLTYFFTKDIFHDRKINSYYLIKPLTDLELVLLYSFPVLVFYPVTTSLYNSYLLTSLSFTEYLKVSINSFYLSSLVYLVYIILKKDIKFLLNLLLGVCITCLVVWLQPYMDSEKRFLFNYATFYVMFLLMITLHVRLNRHQISTSLWLGRLWGEIRFFRMNTLAFYLGQSFLSDTHIPWVKLGTLSRRLKQEYQVSQFILFGSFVVILSEDHFPFIYQFSIRELFALFLIFMILVFINRKCGVLSSTQWMKLLPVPESAMVKSRLYRAFYFPTMMILSAILGLVVYLILYRLNYIEMKVMSFISFLVFQGSFLLIFLGSRTIFPSKIMEHLVKMPRIYKLSFTYSFFVAIGLLYILTIFFLYLDSFILIPCEYVSKNHSDIGLFFTTFIPIILPSILMGIAQTRLLQYGAAHKVLSKTHLLWVGIITMLMMLTWSLGTYSIKIPVNIFDGDYYLLLLFSFVPSLVVASSYCNAKMDAWWMTTQDIDTPIEEKQIYNTPWYKSVFKKQ